MSERVEWGARVTNPSWADYGRVYPMESAIEAERWAVSRNLFAASKGGDDPRLERVRRVIVTSEWERA